MKYTGRKKIRPKNLRKKVGKSNYYLLSRQFSQHSTIHHDVVFTRFRPPINSIQNKATIKRMMTKMKLKQDLIKKNINQSF